MARHNGGGGLIPQPFSKGGGVHEKISSKSLWYNTVAACDADGRRDLSLYALSLFRRSDILLWAFTVRAYLRKEFYHEN